MADALFNDSTPAAPSGARNVRFQKSGQSASANMDISDLAPTSYVDSQDAATLAAAEAYTDGHAGGAESFDEIEAGTNTTAAMVVGTGASLTRAGSGHIDADKVHGAAYGAPGSAGTIPIAQPDGSVAFSDPMVQGLAPEGSTIATAGVSGAALNPVLIGGSDGTALRALKIDGNGHVLVTDDGNGVGISDGGRSITVDGTVAVTGVATAAKQDTGNTALTTLDNDLNSGLGTDGTSPPAFSGGSTGIRAWLRLIYEKLVGSLAVTGTFWQATQPVSISGNQAVNNTQVAGTAIDVNSGAKSAGTMRVVLATDQPQLTAKLLVTPDSVALPNNQSVNISQINAVAPLMGNGVTGTGSQRVTIASDNTAVPVKLVPDTTTGGSTPVSGSIGATATSVKSSAGKVLGYEIGNTNTAGVYMQIFNLAVGSVTLGTTVPLKSIYIPAGGGAIRDYANGWLFSTAITVAFTTTRAGAVAPALTVDYNFDIL